MSAADNKRMIAAAFAATAQGDGRQFVAMLDEAVRWTIIGTTSWSRTFVGRDSVLNELLGPLARNFDGANRVSVQRVIAEDDMVVAEGRNHSRTRAGEEYDNRYCWVFRCVNGKVVEITEYCDTALIERVLAPLA